MVCMFDQPENNVQVRMIHTFNPSVKSVSVGEVCAGGRASGVAEERRFKERHSHRCQAEREPGEGFTQNGDYYNDEYR